MNDAGVRSATTPTTTSGTSRPPAETLTAARRNRRMMPRSVSYPITTSTMITASQATPYTTDPTVGSENSQSKAPGASLPSTLGPISTPATICPTTGGCRSWLAIPPSTRAPPTSSAS